MSVIFLFVDGVGLGGASEKNPLNDSRWKGFNFMSGGVPLIRGAKEIHQKEHIFKGVDARLGVEGLPQSGTGQTALFTGENAPQKIGKHFGPFPHSQIKPYLKQQSIFIKAQKKDKTCAFINAYPDVFFKRSQEKNRWSCTTLMTKSAGIALHTTQDVKKGEALTAGLTQQAWREHLHIDVPAILPEESALRMLRVAEDCDLLLHEYYLTDKAGHSQKKETAMEYIGRYDAFLWTLIKEKPQQTTIVLCSDHGNVEDLSTKSHTLNQVPLFAFGPGAEAFYGAQSIMDVTPGILKILN